jgi:hypothetical protein
MAYKTGQSFAASTNNHPKHHAILVVGSAAGKTAGVTFYDKFGNTGDTVILFSGAESKVLPFQIKNTGVLDGVTLYGLA